jgi:protein TonB
MQEKKRGWAIWLLLRGSALALSFACTLAIFLVLPLMQTIGSPAPSDLIVRSLDSTSLPPPPPPPPPEEEPEEEKPPEPPPKLAEETPPLNLSQLELALNAGLGDGGFGEFAILLPARVAEDEEAANDGIFSLEDLDRKPRALFQSQPRYPQELLRARRRGTVYVVFHVDEAGRVAEAKVQRSTDAAFDAPALDAVRQWRFEPGTRNGRKVQFKMRVPITFNAGQRES